MEAPPPEQVNIHTNGRRFNLSGGPAYILAIALFIVGALWVYGEFILPKTSSGQDIAQVSNQVQEALKAQKEAFRVLRTLRDELNDAEKERARTQEMLVRGDRDLDKLLTLMNQLHGEVLRIAYTLRALAPPGNRVAPPHHSGR